MLVRTWRFATLLFTALTLAMSFCHLLEMPVKMTLAWEEYAVVQGIYQHFGGVGAFLETGSILLAGVLCFLVRRRRPAFALTLTGACCLLFGLVIWFALVAPVNVAWAAASTANPPAEWMSLRSQWEYTHAARAVLHFIALAALQLAAILETSIGWAPQHAGQPEREYGHARTA